ncbi:MAG: hypothetical protein GY719_39545 [bacterium]|nr:hypothetical protein [bacterium]
MSWLEFSRALPGIILVLLVFVAAAMLLIDGLRSLVRAIRSRLARKSRSPEDEAVAAIDRYQGPFHLDESGAVRQRFAHRYEIAFRNEWGCAGKWKSWS